MPKIFGIIIIGVAALGVGVWYYIYGGNNSPDAAATVNGEPITMSAFEKSKADIVAYRGIDTEKLNENERQQFHQEALDLLIGEKLINQAAGEAGIIVENEQVEQQLTRIKGQFEDEAAFKDRLADDEITEETLRSMIKDNIRSQEYLSQTLDFDSVSVDEEDVRDFYDQESQKTEQEMPPFEEIREQMRMYLLQTKEQELVDAHIEQLRQAATIDISI